MKHLKFQELIVIITAFCLGGGEVQAFPKKSCEKPLKLPLNTPISRKMAELNRAIDKVALSFVEPQRNSFRIEVNQLELAKFQQGFSYLYSANSTATPMFAMRCYFISNYDENLKSKLTSFSDRYQKSYKELIQNVSLLSSEEAEPKETLAFLKKVMSLLGPLVDHADRHLDLKFAEMTRLVDDFSGLDKKTPGYKIAREFIYLFRSINKDRSAFSFEQLSELSVQEALQVIAKHGRIVETELKNAIWGALDGEIEKNTKFTKTISKAVKDALKNEMREWDRTVLKGEYKVTGPMKIESVETLIFKNQIYGYRVRVYAKAKSEYQGAESKGTISSEFLLGNDLKWKENLVSPDYSH